MMEPRPKVSVVMPMKDSPRAVANAFVRIVRQMLDAGVNPLAIVRGGFEALAIAAYSLGGLELLRDEVQRACNNPQAMALDDKPPAGHA
jgi:hypothetical protein